LRVLVAPVKCGTVQTVDIDVHILNMHFEYIKALR